MISKRTKCKRCQLVLSIRERAHFLGYCQGCYYDVEKERKRKSQ